jgi:hypothetical protein
VGGDFSHYNLSNNRLVGTKNSNFPLLRIIEFVTLKSRWRVGSKLHSVAVQC